MHAGAGSLIHAIQAGKVPVVMPRRAEEGEHIDDHQMELAHVLEREGRIVVARTPAELRDAVQCARERQTRWQQGRSETPELVRRVSALLDELAGG
jgi:UDP-N-acetylglucosamine transferase subunit ALG13